MNRNEEINNTLLSLVNETDYLMVEEHLRRIGDRSGLGIRAIKQQFKTIRDHVRQRMIIVENADTSPNEIVINNIRYSLPDKFVISESVIKVEYEGYEGEVSYRTVLNALVVPVKRIINIDNGEHSYELLIRKNGREKVVTCGQEVIASTQHIVSKLSPLGVPVNTINAKSVIRFLDEYIHENYSDIPVHYTSIKGGWINFQDTKLFALGDDIFSPGSDEKKFIRDNSKGSSDRIRFYPKGVHDEWLKAVKLALPYDIPLFLISTSIAAPLLSLFSAPSFTVNLEGNSTTGKTTATDLALSFWTDPTNLKSTWNTSLAGIETHLTELNCLVTNLDDASQARSLEHIKRILYLIGNQRGATRSDEKLSRKMIKTFSVVLLSSSESSLLSSSSLQGEAARLIEIGELPWGERSEKAANVTSEIGKLVQSNNGFFGNLYVNHLVDIVNDESRFKELKLRYDFICTSLKSNNLSSYSLRLLPSLTCCHLALEIMSQLLPELHLDSDRISNLVNSIILNREQKLQEFKDLPLRAYTYVWQRILASPRKFDSHEHEIWGGVIKKGEEVAYAILQNSLKKILEEGGFTYSACNKLFKENKLVWLDKDGELYPYKMNGVTTRVFVFDPVIAKKNGVLEESEGQKLQSYNVTDEDHLIRKNI